MFKVVHHSVVCDERKLEAIWLSIIGAGEGIIKTMDARGTWVAL